MSDSSKKYSFSDFFTEGQYQTQVETLAVGHDKRKISIGIPKENGPNESRVSIAPNSVRSLVGYGHKVVVESNAGERSNFTDHDYSEAGAIIAHSKKKFMIPIF